MYFVASSENLFINLQALQIYGGNLWDKLLFYLFNICLPVGTKQQIVNECAIKFLNLLSINSFKREDSNYKHEEI